MAQRLVWCAARGPALDAEHGHLLRAKRAPERVSERADRRVAAGAERVEICHDERKVVLRYATLAPLKEALGPRQSLRRHVPPFLFLLGLMIAILAIARPTATVARFLGGVRAHLAAAVPPC